MLQRLGNWSTSHSGRVKLNPHCRKFSNCSGRPALPEGLRLYFQVPLMCTHGEQTSSLWADTWPCLLHWRYLEKGNTIHLMKVLLVTAERGLATLGFDVAGCIHFILVSGCQKQNKTQVHRPSSPLDQSVTICRKPTRVNVLLSPERIASLVVKQNFT